MQSDQTIGKDKPEEEETHLSKSSSSFDSLKTFQMTDSSDFYSFFDENIGFIPGTNEKLRETRQELLDSKKEFETYWAEVESPTTSDESKKAQLIKHYDTTKQTIDEADKKKKEMEEGLVGIQKIYVAHQLIKKQIDQVKYEVLSLLYKALLACYEDIMFHTKQKKDADKNTNSYKKLEMLRVERIKKFNKLFHEVIQINRDGSLPDISFLFKKLSEKNLTEIEKIINEILHSQEASSSKFIYEFNKLINENKQNSENTSCIDSAGNFSFNNESLKRGEEKIKEQAETAKESLRANTTIVGYVNSVTYASEAAQKFKEKVKRFRTYTQCLKELRTQQSKIQDTKTIMESIQHESLLLIEKIRQQFAEINTLEEQNKLSLPTAGLDEIERLEKDIQDLMQVVANIQAEANNLKLDEKHGNKRRKQLAELEEKVMSSKEINLEQKVSEVSSINSALAIIRYKQHQLAQIAVRNSNIIDSPKKETERIEKIQAEASNRIALNRLKITLESAESVIKTCDDRIARTCDQFPDDVQQLQAYLDYNKYKKELLDLSEKLSAGNFSDTFVSQIDNIINICKANIDNFLIAHYKIVHDFPKYQELKHNAFVTKEKLVLIDESINTIISSGDDKAENIKLTLLLRQFKKYKSQIDERCKKLQEEGFDRLYEENTPIETRYLLNEELEKLHKITRESQACYRSIVAHINKKDIHDCKSKMESMNETVKILSSSVNVKRRKHAGRNTDFDNLISEFKNKLVAFYQIQHDLDVQMINAEEYTTESLAGLKALEQNAAENFVAVQSVFREIEDQEKELFPIDATVIAIELDQFDKDEIKHVAGTEYHDSNANAGDRGHSSGNENQSCAKLYAMLVDSIDMLQANYDELKKQLEKDNKNRDFMQRKLELVIDSLYQLKKLRVELESDLMDMNFNQRRSSIAKQIVELKERIFETQTFLLDAKNLKDKPEIKLQKKTLKLLKKQLRIKKHAYLYELQQQKTNFRVSEPNNLTPQYLLNKMDRFNNIASKFHQDLDNVLLERKASTPKTRYFLERFREKFADGIRSLFSQHASLGRHNHYSTVKTGNVILNKVGSMFKLFHRKYETSSDKEKYNRTKKIM